jgi:hypothetical protein
MCFSGLISQSRERWEKPSFAGTAEAFQDVAERTGAFLQAIQKKTTKIEIGKYTLVPANKLAPINGWL